MRASLLLILVVSSALVADTHGWGFIKKAWNGVKKAANDAHKFYQEKIEPHIPKIPDMPEMPDRLGKNKGGGFKFPRLPRLPRLPRFPRFPRFRGKRSLPDDLPEELQLQMAAECQRMNDAGEIDAILDNPQEFENVLLEICQGENSIVECASVIEEFVEECIELLSENVEDAGDAQNAGDEAK